MSVMSEVTQQGGGGVYYGPYQQEGLYDKSTATGSKELVEKRKILVGCCPIHQANSGWNLGTLPASVGVDADGDRRVICPICMSLGLVPKGL